MSKTKVKSDSHGLYVRTGGYLFRPQLTPWGYPVVVPGTTHRKDSWQTGNAPGKFAVGQEVDAKHLGGTPMGRIRNMDLRYDKDYCTEIWYAHGQYHEFVDGKLKTINSEEIWKPIELFDACGEKKN